jgi:hypothetical protein
LELRRRFFTVPVEMRREFRVEGDLLIVRDHLHMTGPRPLNVMWGHHPTFGSDLLAGAVEITCGGKLVYANGQLDVERGAGQYVNRPPFAAYYDALRKQAQQSRPTAVRR